jgi:hypothetical protein
MKPLYSKDKFTLSKVNELLPFECYSCSNVFYKKKKYINSFLNKTSKAGSVKFCNLKCAANFKNNTIQTPCSNCNTIFIKKNSQIKKTKNHFCSRSCAATYQNTHKQIGTKRSKLEIYLEQKLTSYYPQLNIDFNKKEAINSELDIYIPSLKLAFELNGIFHYEPIYGSEKLDQIQNNDQRKFKACLENSISLCIIDVSKQKYFKESTSIEFLNIIIDIINNKSKNNC